MTARGFPFPAGSVVRTRQGLMRAGQDAGRTCGCGERAVTVLVISRIRGRSGAGAGKTSTIPLCARHDAAHREQARRRSAAQARARLARDVEMRAARAVRLEYMSRPVLTFTLVSREAYL